MTNDLETSTSYFREIREIVAQAFEDAAEYQREPNEVLWETLDGHEWVIYTYKSQQVLAHSRNADYSVEEWGADSIIRDGQVHWAGLAFGAMYGDCMEESTPGGADWSQIPDPVHNSTGGDLLL
jgi:hypothetical protein